MAGIQVPAKLFLAMARAYKRQSADAKDLTVEERQMWLECHRLETRAQSKVRPVKSAPVCTHKRREVVNTQTCCSDCGQPLGPAKP
jgi:hypothetical protein